MSREADFDVQIDPKHTLEDTTTLVVGLFHIGMASITAADYIIRQLQATEIGHIESTALPAVSPFEDGVPRHHSRLYALSDQQIIVLVGELFIPVQTARAFVDSLMEWTTHERVTEIALLHGIPYPHGPEQHDVYHVSTPGYRDTRLASASIESMTGGFLDGVAGELITRSLDDTGPGTGVCITPTHPPGPDTAAALKLLDVLNTLYDLQIDTTELEELGAELMKRFEQLAQRVAESSDSIDAIGRGYPDDRMFMQTRPV